MRNVVLKVDENDVLTITVDLKQTIGLSSTRKNMLIGSASKEIVRDSKGTAITVGLNIYKKP